MRHAYVHQYVRYLRVGLFIEKLFSFAIYNVLYMVLFQDQAGKT